jgi:hypothetical protein
MSNLVKLGVSENKARRAIEALFSTGTLTEARRRQIISKISEGNIQDTEASLIEIFKKTKGNGGNVVAAVSVSTRKTRANP